MTETLKVLVVSPLFSYGGYGFNGRCYGNGLLDRGHDVKFAVFSDYHNGYQLNEGEHKRFVENLIQRHQGWQPDVVLNCMSMGFNKQPTPQVLNTGWETNILNPRVTETISTQDLVTVWSKWNLPTYSAVHKNVKVVPLGIKTSIFNRSPIPHDGFVFGVNAKWEYRKNLSNLVRTFSRTFKNDPKVILRIKTTPFGGISPDEVKQLITMNNEHNAHVLLDLDAFPENVLAQWYNMLDCYVHPSRAEGFDVPMLEAMACGLPVISSKTGGHREFVNQENSLLIDGKMKRIIPHGPYTFGSEMFEPSNDSIEACLKHMLKLPEVRKSMSTKNAEVGKTYSQDAIAIQMENALRSVL